MSPYRKEILEQVWLTLYTRRCRCGRCDCASSDPVERARIALGGPIYSAEFWERVERGRAEAYAELLATHEASACREMGWAEKQAAHERNARRFGRAAERMRRLRGGQPPFVPHPEES